MHTSGFPSRHHKRFEGHAYYMLRKRAFATTSALPHVRHPFNASKCNNIFFLHQKKNWRYEYILCPSRPSTPVVRPPAGTATMTKLFPSTTVALTENRNLKYTIFLVIDASSFYPGSATKPVNPTACSLLHSLRVLRVMRAT